MKNLKQKIQNSIAILFLVLMAFVYILSFLGKHENTIKAEPANDPILSYTDVDLISEKSENIISQLFFDTVRNVNYYETEEKEYFQIVYDNYLLTATHFLSLKFQKEKWEFYCVDGKGNLINTINISDNTEQILRCICIQNTPKNN